MPSALPSTEAIQRISLKNREYAYIEDANRGVVLMEVGPRVLTLEAHLTLVAKERMVEVGAGNWCVVRNPVVRVDGQVVLDDFGQARLAVGDREVRVGPKVFPLYPGEELEGDIVPEYVLGVSEALRLRALTAFTDARAPDAPRRREAGDEWLVRGPGRYVPDESVTVVSLEKARVESEEALARAESDARASRIRSEAELERERLTTQMALERQQRLNDLEVERQSRLAEVEASQFRQRVEALGGGENFVKAVAAQAQAAVVGGLDKVVFLPSGSNLNLFDAMQGLLGPGGAPRLNPGAERPDP
ncbi:hypothetical protein [Corallococcus llansteffanensis]|uniref:Uncharacterized protein n=1 Tax=Corallococcus llansteffanensis TaxID=2316731 RepID=A0A3A8PTY4_9BACT|nr:hypothetical protein [Corallococcus llansteffanensis]RKH54944.1 hypothetical protein D7V93_24280 [Corallococcus llansteffanensis]